MLCDRNQSSNGKVLKMHELAPSKMSQTAAIAENSYKIREWIWSRLSECVVSSRRKSAAKSFLNQAESGIPPV
jgi:hypothetical protein